MEAARGISLHTKMAIGFAVGITAGVLANAFAGDSSWLDPAIDYVTNPVGKIFLNLLFMLVVPLVFSALVLGVVEIGDPRSLGRIGGRTLIFILVVTAIAVSIGMVIVNLVQPGQGLSPELAEELIAGSGARAADIATKGAAVSGIDLLINIVPRNPLASAVNGDLIGVMFFALLFGIGATVVASAGTRSFVGAVQGVYDICLKLDHPARALRRGLPAFRHHRQARFRRARAAGALCRYRGAGAGDPLLRGVSDPGAGVRRHVAAEVLQGRGAGAADGILDQLV
jgi:DAACS family dicarboxylate/amino acid:cation (Na+ or H+) symporter